MRNSEQRPVFVLTTLALIIGILIGAIGMAVLRPPAKAIATNEPKAGQPVKEARNAAVAIQRPQAKNQPAGGMIASDAVPEPQPQAQEEPKPAKQPSAWDLLTPEQKEAERWKEVRRITRKPALSDLEAREAYFKLPFSIKLQMEYALTKDDRFNQVIELHREIASSDFLKKLLGGPVPWKELYSEEEIAKLTAKVRGENFAETTEESLERLDRLSKGEQLEILLAVFQTPVFAKILAGQAIAADNNLRITLHVFSEQNTADRPVVAAAPSYAPELIWPILAKHSFEAYPR